MAIDGHRVNPKLHRVLAEQIPRMGPLESVDAINHDAFALIRRYLEAHRDESKSRISISQPSSA